MGAFIRQYGVLLTDTTAVYLNHPKYGTPTDFAVAADWTPAAGDVKVSKDGGAAANITNLPTYVTDKGWKYILTAAELTAQQVVIRIADSATKVIVDDMFIVETMGNAAAFWPDPDSSNPVVADVVKIGGSTTVVDNVVDDYDGTGYAKANSTTGLVDGAITANKIATGAIDADALAADAVAEIADGVFDEPLSGHTTAGTFGAAVQTIEGTAQSAVGSTITLATSAPATDDIINGRIIVITAGTGAGQVRLISDYVGATRVATVTKAWTDTPDTTSEYVVIGS
jgi:hypothetical protein